MLYLDTSLLVAYYVPEALSALVQRRLLMPVFKTVSELAQTEFVAALALRQRIGDLSLADVQQVATLFARHIHEHRYRSLHLNTAVYQLARDYVARFDLPLKAPDALHLAAATLEELTLVTADRQLARNAELLGVGAELLVHDGASKPIVATVDDGVSTSRSANCASPTNSIARVMAA
jgi:predicted nucleic acid-binding protein